MKILIFSINPLLIIIPSTVRFLRSQVYVQYKILNLTSKRLPAKLVGDFIKDITPLEELDKLKIKNIYPRVLRKKGTGRPTKKEGRILIKNKLIN